MEPSNVIDIALDRYAAIDFAAGNASTSRSVAHHIQEDSRIMVRQSAA